MTTPATHPAHSPHREDQELSEVRAAQLARVKMILDAMYRMLVDHPELPFPDLIDISCRLPREAFDAVVQQHGLQPYGGERDGRWQCEIAHLAGLKTSPHGIDYGVYLPWTLFVRSEDKPL